MRRFPRVCLPFRLIYFKRRQINSNDDEPNDESNDGPNGGNATGHDAPDANAPNDAANDGHGPAHDGGANTNDGTTAKLSRSTVLGIRAAKTIKMNFISRFFKFGNFVSTALLVVIFTREFTVNRQLQNHTILLLLPNLIGLNRDSYNPTKSWPLD